jgi:hypothetical protein
LGTLIYILFGSRLLIIIPSSYIQIRRELVFRSDCKVFDCISSKSEENWCLSWCVGYYTIIIYYILYSFLLIYSSIPILSSSLLFPSSYHLSFHPNHLHSFYTCRYLFMFTHILFIFSSSTISPACFICVGWLR